MILNVNHQPSISIQNEKDQADFFYASAHVAGIGLMFYGSYIGLMHQRIAGLWMVLLGMIVYRLIREAYSRSLVTRALHGKPVTEFMDEESVSIDPSTPLSEIMRRVREDRLVYPVAREYDHELLGVVDVRNTEQFPAQEWRAHQVAEITKPCARDLMISSDEDAEIALERMQSLGLREVLVVKGNRLLGVLKVNSLLARIQDRFSLPNSMHPAT